MMKQKFIPLKKRSKREQREHHAAQRKDWGNTHPATKKLPNQKAYNRKKSKQWQRKNEPGLDFLVVAKGGRGDFNSIQAAVDFLGKKGGKIFVRAGMYTEKVRIMAGGITLIGEDASSTSISYGDYARKIHQDGQEYGTFRSQTVYVYGDDFCAKNISFINSAGKGSDVGQAVAFFGDGDRHSFFGCAFYGHQDTLFLSPLPAAPSNIGAFGVVDIRKDADCIHRSYFNNCIIRGDIDFIFGGSTTYFQGCTIISNDLQQNVNGYITAASTSQIQAHGYVFNQCRLISDAAANTVYLGRPWREFAKVVFINCNMGSHIKPAGWHNWDKPNAEHTAFYAEYGSHGPGGNMARRVPWAKQLAKAQVNEYAVASVLGGWNPTAT